MHTIEHLHVRGRTNISSAISLAAQVVNGVSCPNKVRTVFLLTDGCANVGFTESKDLMDLTGMLVESSHNHHTPPISLHTFGYGFEPDAKLLSKMARVTSGGSFYSVKDNSQVASAFGDAIGGLMSVVAQNGAAIEGSELVAVHHDKQTEICAGTVQVNLGDMYAEETRDVLFEVTLVPPKSALDDTLVLHSIVELSYFDTLKHVFGGPLTGTAFIARPNSSELSWPNKYVAIQWLRVRTAKALYEAEQDAKNGNVDKAKRSLEAWLKEFQRENFEIGSTDPLLDQLLVDLTESLDLLTKTEYNPYSFSTLGVRMQAHFSQRCSEPITGKTSVYRTAQKSLRAQAFNNKI